MNTNTERETNILAEAFATGIITDEAREIARIRAEETRETLVSIGTILAQDVLSMCSNTHSAKERAEALAWWNDYYNYLNRKPDERNFCVVRAIAHGIVLLKLLAIADGQILA